MRAATRNILVGLTVLAALGGLGYMIVVFGELPVWEGEGYHIEVALNTAGGLTPGSQVQLNGITIGKVRDIHLMDDPSEGVVAECVIRRKYKIPVDAEVEVSAGLLGGTASLNIITTLPEPPDSAQVEEFRDTLPRNGTGRLVGRSVSITARLKRIATRLEEDLHKQLENFGELSNRLTKLAEQYIEVGRNINAMLEERTVAEVESGKVSPNLTTIIARLNAGVSKLTHTIDQIHDFVTDPEIRKNLRTAIRNARIITAETREVVNTTGEHVNQLIRRYIAVADDLSNTVDQMNAILRSIRQGEGTVGKLVNDPSLYRNLQDAVVRLQDMLEEAILLIRKWKAEGVPIQL